MPANPVPLLLHIALYARGGIKDSQGNPSYHWAFNVADKSNNLASVQESIKFDATNSMVQETGHCPWRTRERAVKDDVGPLLLARLTIAELKNLSSFRTAIGSVPVVQDDPGFTCKTWLRDAVEAAGMSGCFRSGDVTWDEVEKKAVAYMAEKRELGRWRREGPWDIRLPATWSIIEHRETIP